MKPMPANKLDPKVKNVWRINNFIWITLIAICLAIAPLLFMGSDSADMAKLGQMLAMCVGAGYVVALIVWLVILPPITYIRWRYEVSQDYLDIAKGIIWRTRYTIPFIRVQNTDTRQGPILRAFKLASVTVATAAKEHVIPGLDMETAEQLRDRAAELARLAREDV